MYSSYLKIYISDLKLTFWNNQKTFLFGEQNNEAQQDQKKQRTSFFLLNGIFAWQTLEETGDEDVSSFERQVVQVIITAHNW